MSKKTHNKNQELFLLDKEIALRQELARRAAVLIQEYTLGGEHYDHDLADWQQEVANEETRLGYWEWVANQA